ncbi:TIGR02391 family protein [Nonomuraea typhae]|uniref:TIGR02391 family protein n=1 Tax=Nonomuraea typhae TaxID=2603600 RepID=A0ABW7ZE57_9ACTN
MSQTTLPPAPFPATSVEQICRALAEAVTGPQIPNLIAPLKIPEPAGSERQTKWKRLFNAVAERQNRQGDGKAMLRLVGEVMRPVRFTSTLAFEDTRSAVNEALLYSGYKILDDGRVARTTAATTVAEAQQRADDLRAELSRRGVHPDVLHFCRAELMQRNYFHTVLEASKSVADKLRVLTGENGDGSGLVDKTCSIGQGPRVAFNTLTTEWERSEQNGLVMLMKGLFSTFRNPSAHAPKVLWATSRSDALDVLTLISMLHRRLDTAILHP